MLNNYFKTIILIANLNKTPNVDNFIKFNNSILNINSTFVF